MVSGRLRLQLAASSTTPPEKACWELGHSGRKRVITPRARIVSEKWTPMIHTFRSGNKPAIRPVEVCIFLKFLASPRTYILAAVRRRQGPRRPLLRALDK